MTREQYMTLMEKYAGQIESIRQSAHRLHRGRCLTYNDVLKLAREIMMEEQNASAWWHEY